MYQVKKQKNKIRLVKNFPPLCRRIVVSERMSLRKDFSEPKLDLAVKSSL